MGNEQTTDYKAAIVRLLEHVETSEGIKRIFLFVNSLVVHQK